MDWRLYTSLESAVAKRLYRFLDKRFYYSDRLELDLHELAIRKVRLSADYNVAQMKRALAKGFAELESAWELRTLSSDQRFKKVGKGTWKVIVERKPKRRLKPQAIAQPVVHADAVPIASLDPDQLITRLTKRGVGPGAADDLVNAYPLQTVQTLIELFDWYNGKGQARGAGFLVSAIKNPVSIFHPKGFTSSTAQAQHDAERKRRKDHEKSTHSRREQAAAERDQARSAAFNAFWLAGGSLFGGWLNE